MKNRAIAILMIGFLLAPAAYFAAPRPAHAQFFSSPIVFDPTNFVKNTITALATQFMKGLTNQLVIKEYVLDPIAWVVSQQMIQGMTSSVLNFVGGSNPSNRPQFVQDLMSHLQAVGDVQFYSFYNDLTTKFGSNPFASSIASALQNSYFQNTDSIGFVSKMQCTLNTASPNINGFLNGDWSQGGIQAWVALTTQDQNNPYMFYQAAKSELNAQVSDAQNSRSTQLKWGQGYLPACGGNSGGTGSAQAMALAAASCLLQNGAQQIAQTAGATIKSALDKALGAGQDKMVAADEISEVIGSLAQQLVSNVLGSGISSLTQGANSYTRQYAASAVPAGNTTSSSGQLATNAANTAQQRATDASTYEADWKSILSSANNAKNALQNVVSSCSSSGTQAQGIITNTIDPTVATAQQDIQAAQNTVSLAQQVQNESISTASGQQSQLQTDLSTLQAAPPSASDLTYANQQSQSTGGATAPAADSLSVTGGTLVDQFTLFTSNAQTLASECQAGNAS